MLHRFTRQAMYDLVWTEPMKTLAAKYDLSDRGLAKACAAKKIPVPQRGYWAKLQAGHKVSRPVLPARGLGQSNEIIIGGSANWRYSYGESDAELLSTPLPAPPVFDDDMETIRTRVAAIVKKAPLPKKWGSRTHHAIERLLETDRVRAEKAAATWGSSSAGATPIFNTSFELRRLNILNGLFLCLGFCGMYPSVAGREGRHVTVVVGDTQVAFHLDAVGNEKQTEREQLGYGFQVRDPNARMRLSISGWEAGRSWEDQKGDRIEKHLREIAGELIVAGEDQYRKGVIRHREWLIERKRKLEEQERQRRIEEERQRRERAAQLQKQRVDHLLAQVDALHKATLIRAFVNNVQEANKNVPNPMPDKELSSWSDWALLQANQIDPVLNGSYKVGLQDLQA
jgi:hypothetical protein